MDATRLAPALAAYAAATARGGSPAEQEVRGTTFASMLAETLDDAVDAGRRGEAVATQAALGAADLQDLVEAVNAAELSLQSVVAVRDRIIGAYQDIIRMPI